MVQITIVHTIKNGDVIVFGGVHSGLLNDPIRLSDLEPVGRLQSWNDINKLTMGHIPLLAAGVVIHIGLPR